MMNPLAISTDRVARETPMSRAFDQLVVRVTGASHGIGVDALAVPTDVSVEASCKAMIEVTVAHVGRMDVLVNNAGIGASGRFDKITDLSLFEALRRVNYLGSVRSTAYALPFLKQSRGRVVAISSLTGLTGVPKLLSHRSSRRRTS